MPKQTALEKRREGLTNLGRAVIALVQALPGTITYEDEYQLGLKLRKAIKAAIKADIEGEQSDAQVLGPLDRAVKGANRHLAREVKKL